MTTSIEFTKKNEDFYIGTRLFAKKFLGGYIINSALALDVRTFEDMEAFVTFKAALGSEVTYTEDFTNFFNAKLRFEEWLKSGNASGLTLSEDQQKSRELIESVKNLFDSHFAVSTTDLYARMEVPVEYTTREALIFFANRRATGEGTARPASLRSFRPLRVTESGKSQRVTNGQYDITLAQAKSVWKYAREVWRKAPANASGSGVRQSKHIALGSYNKALSVFRDRIEYGCQSITRYDVERLADEQGWEF